MQWNPPYPDVLIIANGKFPSFSLEERLSRRKQTIIAVDGGTHFCAENNIIPDLITGDFDSVSPEVLIKYHDVMQLPTPDQNKSDLEKALEFIFSFSVGRVTVWGATGVRMDHTLANISLLARYPGKLFYETDEEECFALSGVTEISCKVGQRLSLIPLGLVKGVHSRGLEWELQGSDMSCHFFSLSNVCAKERVEISCGEGNLIACLEKQRN